MTRPIYFFEAVLLAVVVALLVGHFISEWFQLVERSIP